jgi:hypothetical protein
VKDGTFHAPGGRQFHGRGIRCTACAAILLVSIAGCTQRAWYEGVKHGHVDQCREVPESERKDCLSYHDDHYYHYQRMRSEITE